MLGLELFRANALNWARGHFGIEWAWFGFIRHLGKKACAGVFLLNAYHFGYTYTKALTRICSSSLPDTKGPNAPCIRIYFATACICFTL
jgi:hypothetical protein